MNIRPFVPDDTEALIPVLRALQAYLAPLFDRMLPAEKIDRWYLDALLERCAQEHGQILVAEDGGKLVGYAVILCRVSNEEDFDEVSYTYAYVADLCVVDGWRGTGLGRRLLEECEAIARADGARWLRINSLAANTLARQVYAAYGFREHLVEHEKTLE